MTMKKTDLYKNLGKQIERQAKASGRPERFGNGAGEVGKRDKKAPAASKSVPITCRLPAELVSRLRVHAQAVEGGVSAVVESAVIQWLDAALMNENN